MALPLLARAAGLFGASLVMLADPVLAKPALRLLPVTLPGYLDSGELQVDVELPCGSRYFGLLAAVQGDALKVAAAVMQDPVACTTMPQQVTLRVDYLATTAFRTITPLEVREGQRLRVAPIDQVQRQAGDGQSARLVAAYTPRCGKTMGVLIHRSGNRLELGMAEAQAERSSGEVCQSAPKLHTLTALEVSAQTEFEPLHDQPLNPRRAYVLKMAPVDQARIVHTGSGLQVSYQRKCNEAPVGLVLGGLRAQGAKLQVGVLVASYPNLRCADDGERWFTWNEPALRLPERAALGALALDDEGLRLRVPSHLLLNSRGGRPQNLVISYFAACDAEYAVYARDQQGTLAVGVLAVEKPAALQATGTSRCKKALAEVSLQQPFVAPTVRARELYPMRLKGL